jgi:hypothetical protein
VSTSAPHRGHAGPATATRADLLPGRTQTLAFRSLYLTGIERWGAETVKAYAHDLKEIKDRDLHAVKADLFQPSQNRSSESSM